MYLLAAFHPGKFVANILSFYPSPKPKVTGGKANRIKM